MANRYWIGDGGDWDSTAHWSLTSGGAGGEAAPTSSDDVFFDANSFTTTGQTVAIPFGGASAKSLNFTGTTNAPTLDLTFILHVYGNVVLIAGISITGSYGLMIHAACSLTSNGNTGLSEIGISTGGSLALQDDLTVGYIYPYDEGTLVLDTNGHTLNIVGLEGGGSATTADAVILDGSTINISGTGSVFGFYGNATISAIGTTINIDADGSLVMDDYNETGEVNSISGSAGSKCTIAANASATLSGIANTTFTNVTVTGQTLLAPTASGNTDGGGNTGILFYNSYTESSIESLALSDGSSASIGLYESILDLLFVYEELTWAWKVTNNESLVLTDTISNVLGLLISDWLTLIDTETNNWNGQDIISDTLNLYDISQGAKNYADTISESLVATDTGLYALTVTVLEYLGFTDLATAMKSVASSVSESLTLTDSAERGFALAIAEALTVVDASSVVTTFLGAISEPLSLVDTVSPIKKVYPTVSESLTFTETVTSKGTLYNAVYDTLAMNVTVELNGEVYECYVLNTPKFLPSMYSGFNFNSYCVFENRAFGANDTGIFELTGTTDAGTTIRTGAILSETDFGAANQKRFRKGYLGISGSSPVMVFETEDGARQAYNIDTKGRVTASHDLKGKKWKLSIADFDELSTIKLIPIILSK